MERINYRHHIIEVEHDTDPFNPREECDGLLGTFVMTHRHYSFGDEEAPRDLTSWGEVRAQILRENDVAVILPVYMYDHGGITINTTGFSCPWDSGRIGFIYATKPQARDLMGYKVVTAKRKEQIRESLVNEIKELDNYLTGDVYCYTVKKLGGQEIDSCHGFYGSNHIESGLLEQAKSVIDAEHDRFGEQMEMVFDKEAANV
jgi:hypothetical protein